MSKHTYKLCNREREIIPNISCKPLLDKSSQTTQIIIKVILKHTYTLSIKSFQTIPEIKKTIIRKLIANCAYKSVRKIQFIPKNSSYL